MACAGILAFDLAPCATWPQMDRDRSLTRSARVIHLEAEPLVRGSTDIVEGTRQGTASRYKQAGPDPQTWT